jgi:hypothetical protein
VPPCPPANGAFPVRRRGRRCRRRTRRDGSPSKSRGCLSAREGRGGTARCLGALVAAPRTVNAGALSTLCRPPRRQPTAPRGYPSSNLSIKYTFLRPGLHLIPRTSLTCLNGIPIPDRGHCWDSILLFLSELVDAGQRALCIAEIRNPVAAVQTQPRRLPTSVPTVPECSSLIRSGSATPVVRSGGTAKAQPSRAFS